MNASKSFVSLQTNLDNQQCANTHQANYHRRIVTLTNILFLEPIVVPNLEGSTESQL